MPETPFSAAKSNQAAIVIEPSGLVVTFAGT